jgi:hypothetical protein
MKTPSLVMTVVMLAIFVAMVSVSSGYPAGARFMTFVVGIPAIALCLLQLAFDIYRQRAVQVAGGRGDFKQAQDPASTPPARRENLPFTETRLDRHGTVHRELIVWGYFLGLIAAVLLFGFRIAVPLFLVGFLRFQAEATWRNSLVFGIGASALLLLLFEKGLGAALHAGFITEYLLSLRDG